MEFLGAAAAVPFSTMGTGPLVHFYCLKKFFKKF